jgi:hypothetical protein
VKWIITLFWFIAMPIAILKVSYDIALAYVEMKAEESFKEK